MKSSFLALVLVVAACGPKPAPTTTTNDPKPAAESDASCALEVPGTSISVEDADGGAAWVFVTTGDVAAVRARVAKLVELHNARPEAEGSLANTCGGCMADTVGIPSTATAVEIDGGAKAVFVAKAPDGAAGIAGLMRMHGGHLGHAGASCKMAM